MSADKCAHDWRERDYVCKLCGAVKRGAPPLWVFELRISPGLWAVLLALWTFADGTPDSRPVWPGNAALRARARGIAASTLRERLAELKSLGWIRLRDTHRREFELAWLDPYPPETRTLPAGNLAPRRKPGPPETQRTPAGNLAPDRQGPGADPPETWTHTYHDVGSDLGLTEVEARATPTPSVKPAESGVLDPPPNYPAHVQAHLARVTKAKTVPSWESRLPAEAYRDIEAHDGGAWHSQLMSQNWADALADALDDLSIDLGRAKAVLDAHRAQTRGGPTAGVPSKSEIWWANGKRGQRARAWVIKTLHETRTQLRVVDGPSAYELELEEMRR